MLKKSVELRFLSGGTIINIRDVTACRRLDSSESVNTNILREGSMGKNPPSCPVMKQETNEMRVWYDYCWVFTVRLVTPRQQLQNKSMCRYREGSTTPVVCNDTINYIILMTGLKACESMVIHHSWIQVMGYADLPSTAILLIRWNFNGSAHLKDKNTSRLLLNQRCFYPCKGFLQFVSWSWRCPSPRKGFFSFTPVARKCLHFTFSKGLICSNLHVSYLYCMPCPVYTVLADVW